MIYSITFRPELNIKTEAENLAFGQQNDVMFKKISVNGGGLHVSHYISSPDYRDIIFVGGISEAIVRHYLNEENCYFIADEYESRLTLTVKSDKTTSFCCKNKQPVSLDVTELLRKIQKFESGDFMVINEPIGVLTDIDSVSKICHESYRSKAGLILRCDAAAIKAAVKFSPYCLFVDREVLADYFGKTPTKENDFIDCAISLQKAGALSVIVKVNNRVIIGLDDFGGIYKAEFAAKSIKKDLLPAVIGGFVSASALGDKFYKAFCAAALTFCADPDVTEITTLRAPIKKEVIRNVAHYLKENKDFSLTEKGLNILDLAVFSQLPMLDIGTIESESVTISRACEIFAGKNLDGYVSLGLIVPQTYPLLALCAKGKRFNKAEIICRKSIIDEERVVQFIAMTVRLSNGDYVVSYSGTDDTIVGWKEDFYLLYDKPTESQLYSVEYLNQTFEKIAKDAKVYVVGHSKGGNLAIYGAVGVDEKYRDRIAQVVNFDGPGFTEKFYDQDGFTALKDKIVAVIPQLSVIGRLFIHEERVMIVKSCFAGIYQHDLLSWETSGDNFVLVPKLDELSDKVQNKVNEVTGKLTPAQRKIFVEGLFSMLYSTDSFTLTELLSNRGKLFGSFFKCDSKTRNLLFKVAVDLGADRYVREMLMISLRESKKMQQKKDFEEITIGKGDIDNAIESIGVVGAEPDDGEQNN